MKTLAREACRVEIGRRLRALRADSVPRWGRMTAPQMVCHLSDSCRLVLGQKTASDATGLMQRTFIKWIALYLPLPWPAGIPTRPEIDQEGDGTSPGEFAADVADLEALMALVVAKGPETDWPVHPIFGRLSRAAWLRWAYLHTDHHLRQFAA